MTELVAGSETIAATPSTFVHVFTQRETFCSANDSTFIFAHRFFFADVDVEALEDGAQSELKHVHDWKLDQVILGKYRADLLGKLPQVLCRDGRYDDAATCAMENEKAQGDGSDRARRLNIYPPETNGGDFLHSPQLWSML
jgi:hypothetical protein